MAKPSAHKFPTRFMKFNTMKNLALTVIGLLSTDNVEQVGSKIPNPVNQTVRMIR
jgi:hypothetical protein